MGASFRKIIVVTFLMFDSLRITSCYTPWFSRIMTQRIGRSYHDYVRNYDKFWPWRVIWNLVHYTNGNSPKVAEKWKDEGDE
jgi:hypothetical protein